MSHPEKERAPAHDTTSTTISKPQREGACSCSVCFIETASRSGQVPLRMNEPELSSKPLDDARRVALFRPPRRVTARTISARDSHGVASSLTPSAQHLSSPARPLASQVLAGMNELTQQHGFLLHRTVRVCAGPRLARDATLGPPSHVLASSAAGSQGQLPRPHEPVSAVVGCQRILQSVRNASRASQLGAAQDGVAGEGVCLRPAS